jgi:hypothetical protein
LRAARNLIPRAYTIVIIVACNRGVPVGRHILSRTVSRERCVYRNSCNNGGKHDNEHAPTAPGIYIYK